MQEKKIYSDSKFEKFSYADEVIRQTDRVNEFLPVAMSKKDGIEKYEVLSAYVYVRLLHSLVSASVYDKEYNKKLNDLTDLVKKSNTSNFLELKENRLTFLIELLECIDVEAGKFGYVGLLPGLDDITKHTTDESKKTEEDKAMELAYKIIRKSGKKILEIAEKEKIDGLIKDE